MTALSMYGGLSSRASSLLAIVMTLVAVTSIVGIAYGNEFVDIARDIRRPLHFIAGACVGMTTLGWVRGQDPTSPDLRKIERMIVLATGLLLVGASVISFGVLAGYDLTTGAKVRTAVFASAFGVEEFGSKRILTPATAPLMMTASALFTLLVMRANTSARLRWATAILTFLAIAAALLSQARFLILGWGVTALLLAVRSLNPVTASPTSKPRNTKIRRRAVVRWGVAGLTGIALISSLGWLNLERLITSSLPGKMSTDSSVGFRETELAYALDFVLDRPLLGGGAGARYRPPLPNDRYEDAFGLDGAGPLFVHNFYLWLAVKGGILALTMFAVLVGYTIQRAVRHPDALVAAFSVSAASMSIVFFVGPTMITQSAAALGLFFGVALAGPRVATRRRPDRLVGLEV